MGVTKEEISSWIKSIKQLAKARTKADMTILMDVRPIEVFENRFLKREVENPEEMIVSFLDLYETFAQRVIAGSEYESGSNRLVDSISSLAKLIYLMDLGYGIYISILFDRSGLIADHFPAQAKIKEAFDILFKKRYYLQEYLDPFANYKIKLENEKEK